MPEPTCQSCDKPLVSHPSVQELCRRNAELLKAADEFLEAISTYFITEKIYVCPVCSTNLGHTQECPVVTFRNALAESTPKPSDPEKET